jgi:hypothetical protein
VLDSGFGAGDGVYDVIRTFRHKPFRLPSHGAVKTNFATSLAGAIDSDPTKIGLALGAV